jgi:hypothetical protein
MVAMHFVVGVIAASAAAAAELGSSDLRSSVAQVPVRRQRKSSAEYRGATTLDLDNRGHDGGRVSDDRAMPEEPPASMYEVDEAPMDASVSFMDVRELTEHTTVTRRMNLPIRKYSKSAVWLGNHVSVPGPLTSAPLYILDVHALPRENAVAVQALHSRSFRVVRDEAIKSRLSEKVTEELMKMQMTFNSKTHHTFSCKILGNGPDGNCVGGTHILYCRIKGFDLETELMSSSALELQLGTEIINISTKQLSAGSPGHWLSRQAYTKRATNSPLSASVALAMYGATPAYLSETMRFFNMSGLSHVYIGLFSQKIPGGVRKELEPFISQGFVSVLETDDFPGIYVDNKFNKMKEEGEHGFLPIETWKTMINDWSLYHAKKHDDLLLIHDYDEMMVPLDGGTVPHAMEKLLQGLRSDGVHIKSLSDVCHFNVCPIMAFSSLAGRKTPRRENISRAHDFPIMDGGGSTEHKSALGRAQHCSKGGYNPNVPKAIAVVENIYKTSVHVPGQCSVVVHGTTSNVGPRVDVHREQGLIVQHFTEVTAPGRIFWHDSGVDSVFTRVWGPKLKV